MHKAVIMSFVAVAVYALATLSLVNGRTLQQTGGCSMSPGPQPEECTWEWKRDEIECRGLANGTKLECETENDGRYIECEFEQSRQFEIKFTCDVDIDCQIQCGESALSNIPTSYRGQVESILNAWVPYDD